MRLTMEEHGGAVRRWLQEGRSYRSIANELGCSKDTVSIFCKVNFPAARRVATQDADYQTTIPEVRRVPPGSAIKLLVIDIETRPSLAYVWDVWKQNIAPRQLIEEKEVISFAAKWVGDDEVMFYSTFHNGQDAMVKAAWELLDECDAVIHYNGTKFDIPHLNLEFVKHIGRPPSQFRNVDLLQTIRRDFNFTHNKLDHVADKLGIGKKLEHEGFSLWLKCMEGDTEAWTRMREYNIQDVRLTEELYVKIRPWIKQHPSFAVAMREFVCPTCGSGWLISKGETNTKTRAYQRFVCNSCGASSRKSNTHHSAEITATTSW